MSAGRPRIPEEVKLLQGTARRDRQQAAIEGRQPATLLAEIPDPPEAFNDKPRAQYQWGFVCEELFNLGMLRPMMLDWIELYCLYMHDCFMFRERAEATDWIVQYQDGEGHVTGESVSRFVELADRSFNKAQQMLKLLSLDPATVKKLSPPAPEKPKSKLQRLMNKGR